jgi:hypothetical protein
MMNLESRAEGLKSLIRDRDTKFTAGFDAVFTTIGVRIVKESRPGAAGERDRGTPTRESRTPGHCTRCRRQSPSPAPPPAFTSTDGTCACRESRPQL